MIKTIPIFNMDLVEFAEIELSKILFIYKKFHTDDEQKDYYKVQLVNKMEVFISDDVYKRNFTSC